MVSFANDKPPIVTEFEEVKEDTESWKNNIIVAGGNEIIGSLTSIKIRWISRKLSKGVVKYGDKGNTRSRTKISNGKMEGSVPDQRCKKGLWMKRL